MNTSKINNIDNKSYTYYYEELLLSQVLATAKEIHKRLIHEECKLATECHPGAAYITLNLKNGDVVYVARGRKYNQVTKDYTYTVQILEDAEDNKLQLVMSNQYRADRGIKSEVPDNMLPIAAKIIRMNKRK